ncbi:Ig-like domain-containing protein [Grimontia kaedaensis]|uniref:Ig-like domain-containing protein n=1 Tax=Grimontia kaedaensis TaxID=2872157 RepID=A0ABY4WNN6_9GAMM|nr:Ig-like domain-containing protein [Grimontia kaedaensis]USH01143.1 Ig-like domain-containing protein [Grimontia kaedaensis]
MGQVKVPNNAEVLFISGSASLDREGGKQALKLGTQLHSGDTIDVAEDTLIEFQGDDGSLFAFVGSEIDSFTDLASNQNLTDELKDQIKSIVDAISLGQDPTLNEENATAAGTTLLSSGSSGFFVLSRSASETIATAGFDTDSYIDSTFSGNLQEKETESFFSSPTISLDVDTLTNDNTPTISGQTNLPPGTVVQLTITDSLGSTQTLTPTVTEDGTFSIEVPTPLPDGSFSVTATFTDNQGNSISATANGILDTLAPGQGTGPNGSDESPLVEIPQASGGIGEEEVTDGVEVLVTPPTGTEPGDTITVTVTQPDGSTTDVTTTVPDGWTGGSSVSVVVSPEDLGGSDGSLPDEGDYTITTTVTDNAGNTSSPSETITVNVDTTAPGEGTGAGGANELPLVEVPEASGGIGESELTDGVEVLVTPPTGTEPGDTVTVTVTQPDGSTSEVTTTVPDSWTDGSAVSVVVSPEDLGGAGGTLPDEGDYTLTTTITDSAGNTSSPSESITVNVDTTAPGEGTGAGGANKLPLVEVPEASGGIGENELTDGVEVLVTPPTGTEPGDTITVTVTQPDGSTTDVTTTVPDGWTGGSSVSVVVSPEDLGGSNGSLPNEGDYTITSTVTDSAGNTSSPSESIDIIIDTTAPGEGTGPNGTDELPLVEVPEASGGIGEEEITDGVEVLVTPPTGTEPGDTITVTVTQPDGSSTDVTTTVPDGWTGGTSVPVTVSPEELGGENGELPDEGDYTITTTVTDSAGNTSSPSESIEITIDTSAPGEGTGPNGNDELPLVEVPEASGGVGESELTDGVEVLVTPPTGTEPGDTITVTVTQPDGSSTDVTTTVPDGWTGGTSVPVTVSPEDLGGDNGQLPDEGDYTITTTVTDSAGNTSSPSESVEITIDTTAPGEGTGPNGTDELPLVEVPEASGGVGEDELTDGVEVLVTPPTGTEPGDTITVTVTQPDGSSTDVTTTVPAGWTGGTSVPVTVSPEELGGENGELPDEGDYTLTATVTDGAGNTSTPSDASNFTVDTTAPGEGTGAGGADEVPLVAIPEAADGVNKDEASDGIDVLVTPPTGIEPGDTVTVTLTKPDGTTADISATVPADWTDGTAVTVTIPTSDIGDGSSFNDGDYTLTATASDTAGNSSQPSASTGFTLDTTAPGEGTGPNGTDELPLVEVPEASGGVGEEELTDGVEVLVTPPTGTEPGDTITVTVTQPDGSTTDVTTTVPAGWTGGTSVPVTVSPEDLGGENGELPDEGDYTLTATVTDGAGNTSSPSDASNFTVDTTAPGEGTGAGGADEVPLVAIPEAADGVNKDEASDGIDVLVTPPTGIEPGDTVTVTLTKPDGSTADISATVPAGWTDGTAVTVTIPTSDIGDGSSFNDGDYTLTATASDTAGNSSQPSASTGFTLDTTAPGEGTGPNGTDELPIVEVPEASGGVGEDELTDGVEVLVTPPTGTEPGDTITVTVTQPDGSTTDVTTTVPAGWTGGTSVPVTVSPEDLGGENGELPDEGDYTLTATVTDGAGNTSSPSDASNFTVDTTAPGEGTGAGGADEVPLVAIPEAADGVNKDEASDGIDVLVTPPTGIEPGDTVTVTLTKPDGSTADISTTVPADWTDGTAVTVTIPTSDIGDGSSFNDGDYTLTATASDTAGNSSAPSSEASFNLDTTAPGEGTGPNGTDELPIVEVPEASGGVGEDELTDGVEVLVTPPTGTEPGDTITVTVTQPDGSTTDVTTTVPAGWTVGTSVPVTVSPADLGGENGELPDEGDYTLTATVTDGAGNTSSPSDASNFTVDTTAPGEGTGAGGADEVPLVAIPEAADGVNKDEASDGIDVLVTPPTGIEPGDTVTVTLTKPDGSTADISATVPAGWTDGTAVTVTIPTSDIGDGSSFNDGDYTLTATASDTAGNSSQPSASTGFTLDTTAPGEGTGPNGTDELPIVEVPEASGGVGEDELTDGVEVLVTPPTGTEPGDTITVTVTQPDGSTTDVTTTVPAGWTGGTSVPVTVSPEDLGGENGELPDEGDYTLTATVTDGAGNTSSPSDASNFTVDTTAPGEGTGAGGADEVPLVAIPEAADGVNKDEASDGIDVLVTPPTGIEPGDTVTVTLTKPDGTTADISTTVPADWTDGTAVTVTIPTSDIGDGSSFNDGDYTLTATASDTAGNSSAPSSEASFNLDTTAPGEGTGPNGTDELPIVEVPEASGGVGEDELTDGVEVLVTPPTGTEPGDTITVTVTQPDGSTTDVTTTVPAGWTGGTSVPVTVSPEDLGGENGELPDEGDYTLTATVTDGAGNTSSPSDASNFTVDTTAPGEGTGAGGADEVPLVAIPEAADGVNKDEASDGIDVLVTPPTGIEPGDTVTVTLTKPDGSTADISATVPADWTDGTAVTVTIPTSDIGDGSSFNDGDYTLTATASDTAGNSSQPSASTGFTLDTTAPGEGTGPNGTVELPLVEIPEASGGVGENELTDGVEVLVTPPTGTEPGDTITVTVTQPDGSTTDVTTTVPAGWTGGTSVPVTVSPEDLGGENGELPDEGDYTLTATVTDGAGNTSTPSDASNFTVDTTAPGEGTGAGGADEVPLVAIPEAADGVNKDEASDGIDVLVTPPTGIEPGDTVTVTLTKPDGTTADISATVPADWTDGTAVTVTIPTSDIGDGSSFNDGDYTLTATASDTAGNSSQPSASTGFTLDTTAPGEGTGPNGTDELPLVEVPEASGGVGEEELTDGVEVLVTPPTGTEPGDTITVTVTQPDGSTTDVTTTVPAGWTGGTSVPVTVSPEDLGGENGELPDEGDYTLTATVTDGAGNTSSPSDASNFTVDTTAPGEGTGAGGADEVPLVAIPEAADGVNKDEASDGIDVLVTPPTGIEPGDTVTVTLTKPDGSTADISATVPAGWTDGTAVTVTIPTSDIGDGSSFNDGDYTLTATASDTAGNSSQPSASTGFTLDTTAPGEGTGPNGTDELPIVEVPEASGGVGEDELTDGVEVLVTPPTGTEPGDTITVTVTQPDGSTTDVTTTVPAGWTGGTSVPVTVSPEDLGGENGELPDEGDYTLTATVTDGAGNTSSPSDASNFTVDTTAPGEGTGAGGADEVPLVAIPEAADGVNKDEASDGIDVLVTPPTGIEPGDTVTVTLTKPDGSTADISTTVPADWTDGTAVTVTIPTSDIGDGSSFNDGDYTLTATASDTAGNSSQPSASTGFTLDTTAPGESTGAGGADEVPLVAIPEAADGVNKDEASDGIDVLVTPPTGIEPGDTVTVTLTKPDGSTADISATVPADWTDGTAVTVTIPTSHIGEGSSFTDGDYTLTAVASDTAGNSSEPSASTGFTLDTTAPDKTTTSIIIDDISNDNIINIAEQNQSIEVTGQVSGEFTEGDTVVLTVDGTQYTGAAEEDGSFTITVPGTALTSDSDTVIEASVLATDSAGNVGEISTTKDYDTDLQGPTASTTALTIDSVTSDNVLNAAEASMPVNVTGTVTGEFTEGDVVTLNVGGKDFIGKVDAEGNYSIPVPGIDLMTDGNSSVTATILASDPAGNTGTISADKDYNVDIVGPSTLTTTLIIDTITSDNVINIDESESAINITGTVSGEYTAGNIITLTINGKDFNGPVAANGTFSISVPGGELVSDNDTTVDARLIATDAAGNLGVITTAKEYLLDLVAPGQGTGSNGADEAPIVAIAEAADGVNKNEANDGIQAQVTPPAGTLPGDTITLTLSDPDGHQTTLEHTVPNGWVAGQVVEVTIPVSDISNGNIFDDGVYNLSATVTDAAGNTSLNSNTTTFELDTIAPGEGMGDDGSDASPTLVIHESSNGVNAQEASDGIQTSVTPPVGAEPGDSISLEVTDPSGNTSTITVAVPNDWQDGIPVPITIPVNQLQNGGIYEDGTYGISATVTDAAGNTSTAAEQTIILDTTEPSDETTQLTIDVITADNVVNAKESGTSISVTGTAIGEYTAGDKVTLSVNGNNYTGTVNTNGEFSIAVPGSELVEDSDLKVNAQLVATDPAGNTGVISTTQIYSVDLVANASITLDSTIAGDDAINYAESQQDINITGVVGGDAKPGDVVTITVNNTEFTGTVNADNSFKIPVSGSVLASAPDKTIKAEVTATDNAGNTVTVTDSETYTAYEPKVESVTHLSDAAEGESTIGWNLNLDHATTIDTTVKLGFAKVAHDVVFGEDYTGKVYVYNDEGDLLQEVELNSSNQWVAHITVPAGESGVKLYAETVNDDIYEGDETFAIYAAANTTEGWQNWVKSESSIISDEADKPKVTSVSNASVDEGEAASVTITLSNESTTPTRVFIDAYGGSATEGTDFNTKDLWVNYGSGWVKAAGDFSGGNWIDVPANTKTFQVRSQSIQDDVFEGNESYTIKAKADGQSSLVSGTVTINDDTDTPKVNSITHLNDGVEGGAWPGWTVNMTNTSTTSTTVRLHFDDGLHQANFGEDYSGKVHVYTTSGTFLKEVVLNSSNGWAADIDVPAGHAGVRVYAETLNDNVYEGNETIKVQGAVIGQQGWVTSADAVITDEADRPSWEISNASTTEGDYLVWDISVHTATKDNSWTKIEFANGTGIIGTDTAGATSFQASYDGGNTWNAAKYYGNMLQVPKGTESFKVRLATTDDSVFEGNETITIKVTESGGGRDPGVVFGTTTNTATIVENDDATVVTSVTKLRDGVEGSTTPGWTVNFNNPSDEATTVRLNFNDGYHEADVGADYSGRVYIYNLSGQKVGEEVISAANNWRVDISVPAGQNGVRVYAQTLNDNVYEGNETIQIQAAVPGRQGFVQSAEAVITDEADKPRVTSVSNTSVNEGEAASVTITLSNESTTPTRVFVDAYGGSATEGTDFNTKDLWVNYGSGWVKAAGDFSGGNWIDVPANTQTFQVRSQTTQDDVFEGNESYTIKAKADGQSSLVSGTVTINDNTDTPKVDSITLLQNGVENSTWPGWTVNMTNTSTTSTTVRLHFDDGLHQANFGEDYSGKVHVYTTSGAFLKEVVLNSSNGWAADIDVPAGQAGVRVYAETLNDNVYEGNETIKVQGAVIGQQGWVTSADAVITDEADKPRVTSVSNTSVNEGEAASLTITLSNESNTPTRVFVDAYGGSATEGTDFNTKDLWVNYGSGWVKAAGDFSGGNWIDVPANTKTFQVRSQTTQDDVFEGSESYTIKAKADGQSSLVSGTVTINDNADTPKVASITHLNDGVEGGAWPGWTVNMTNTSTTSTTVRLHFDDGLHQANFGEDYSGKVHVRTTSGAFLKEVVLNSSNGWAADIDVPAGHAGVRVYAETLNDNVYEGNETIKVQGAVIGQQGWVTSADAVINDEADRPSWEISNASTTEGDYLVWDISVHTATKDNSWTKIEFANGTGIIGTDTTGATNFQASYDGGVTWGATKYYGNQLIVPKGTTSFKVRLATTDDSLYEGNETITIKVTESGGGRDPGVVFGTTTNTATIVENDDATVVTSVTKLRDGVEGSTTPGWTVNFNNPSDEATTVRLNFNDSYHEADIGADYSGRVYIYNLAGQKVGEEVLSAANNWRVDISVPAGQNGVRVYAQTLNDNVYEGNETIQIQAAVPGRQGFVQSDEAVITDEADKPRVTSVSNTSVDEGEAASVTITLSNESNTPTRVFVDAYGGSATEGTDFNTKDLWVNYGSGWVKAAGDFSGGNWIDVPANTKTFQVRSQTTQDDVFEGNESYTIKAKADGQSSLVSGTVTINDNADTPKVASITHLNDGVEGGAWPGWTVNMTNTSTTSTTVRLHFDDGLHQANFGEDYSGKVHVYTTSGTFLKEVVLNSSNGWAADIDVPAGHAGVRVYAETLNDNVYEGNETIKVQGAVIGQQGWVTSADAVITDEADRPSWEISNASTTEGDYLVWDISVHTATKDNSWTKIEFANGTGTIGTDTTGATNFQASYDGGVTWGATKYYGNQLIVPKGTTSFKVRLATTDDSLYEGNETITIKVTESGGGRDPGVVFGTTTNTATIVENDDATVVTSVTKLRDGVEGSTTPGWTVNFNNPSDEATTVRLNFNDGYHEADVGADYSGRVYIYNLAGQKVGEEVISAANNWRVDISVPAGQNGVRVYAQTLNDNVYEGNETIQIQAAVPGRQGFVQSAEAVITDEADKPSLSVINTNSSNKVNESNWATFNIKLSNPVDQSTKVKVNVYTGAEPGITNKDLGGYEYWTGSAWANFKSGSKLTFAAYQTEIQIRVKPIDDNKADGNETLIIKAKPVGEETHIQSGEVQGSVLVVDKGYQDTSNSNSGHVHWHIDGGGAQHLVGNGWRPNEKVTLFGPDGSKTVVYADNFGNFHRSGDNLYTATGTLTARGKESGDTTDYITPNITPIVLDLDGDGIETSDVTEAPVGFDYDGDGEKVNTGWVSGGDGLLVHDVNKDGQINDGSELFGSNTLLQDGTTAADGYEALAQHDSNADGVIDKNDAIYADLNVWVDKDQDGETDEGELLSMGDAGVASINLDAQTTDDEQNNNVIGKTSTYTTTGGEERAAADVWFATQQAPEEETSLVGLIEEHSISGLDSEDLVWHSENVTDQPWSDTVTDFTVGQSTLDLSDLVTDREDHLLSEDNVDMFEQDGSLILRVDTDGDHTWNQEIILQDVSLDDIIDQNGMIKSSVFGDDNVKELFQKAAATDVVENTSTHLENPTLDDHL